MTSSVRYGWLSHRRRRFSGLLAASLFALFTPGRGVAAEPAPAEIAQAVRDLSASAYRVREQAGILLWRAGPAAEAALRQALTCEDPEVVDRARKILDKLDSGICPDTPTEVVELVRQFKAGGQQQAIRSLIDHGEAGLPVLSSLLRTTSDDAVRLLIGTCLEETNAVAVSNLLQQGKRDLAEKMLELGAATGADACIRAHAAWLLCGGRLPERIARLQADSTPGPLVLRQLVYLHRANGDLTNAIACAVRLADPYLTCKLRLEIGDWQALARDPGENEGIERMGFQAAYHRLAGNRAEFERALQTIRVYAQHPLSREQTWYVAKALLLNDRIQEAMELLRRAKMYRRLLDLLNAQGRFEEAFRLVDQARVEKDGDLWSIELEQARVMYVLGQTNEARQIVLRVLADQGATANSPTPEGRHRADEAARPDASFEVGRQKPPPPNIVAAVSVGLIREAADLAAPELEQFPVGRNEDLPDRTEERQTILRGLYPDFAARADAWLSLLHAEFPQTNAATHLARLYGYFIGRHESLREYIGLADKAAETMSRLPSRERQLLWQSLADAHTILGAWDQAAVCERKGYEISRSVPDGMRLVRRLGNASQWREAAATAREAYARVPAPEYLWACGWATMRAGDEKTGREEMDHADLQALAAESSREALAELLRSWGAHDAAARQEEMLLRLGDFETWEYGGYFRHLMNRASRTNDLAAYFTMQEKDRLFCLRTSRWFCELSSYLLAMAHCRVAAARLALAGGRTEEALEHIRVVQEGDPLGNEVVITLTPLLAKAGRKDAADEIFRQSFQTLTDVSRRFPNYKKGHNAVAWLAACLRRELPVGLEHARAAVGLDPADVGCRDTLAEVLFQLGRRDEAVSEMKKCIEQKPWREYFRRQLKRMQDGDPATEPPLEAE